MTPAVGAPNGLKFTRCVRANWLNFECVVRVQIGLTFSPFGARQPGRINLLFVYARKF